MHIKNKHDFFSTLWIFVTLNYLYCDVMGLMDSNLLKQYLSGSVEGLAINERFLLYAALLMEVPLIMVLLSKILKKKANVWANIIAGTIKTVAMITTLLIGTSASYYLFFAAIEIATTTFIVGYAIYWSRTNETLSSAIT